MTIQRYNLFYVLVMIWGTTPIKAYLYDWTIKNGLDHTVKVKICTRSVSNWCSERTLMPGDETTWTSNGECLDYLRIISPELGEIETRPGYSKAKVDTLPTTGLGLSCRNIRVVIKRDWEDAAILEEY